MKLSIVRVLGVLIVCLLVGGCRTSSGEHEGGVIVTAAETPAGSVVDVSVFYDQLAPYGEWVPVDSYGWCWTPYGVHVGWRPYTHGHWVWTECGSTWVSDWPWGWAPFHYGRWFFHDHHGWMWVPGTDWGPGWVAWREGPRCIGWAPLPPHAGWDRHGGLRGVGPHFEDDLDSLSWSFVARGALTRDDADDQIFDPTWNPALIRETTGITRYEPLHDRVENRSLAIETVEREAGRPVPRLRLADADGPGSAGFHRDRPDELRVYRPPVSDAKSRREPVAAPPQGRAPTPELKGRQVLEQRELDERHARDKRALEEEIRRGATRPPTGIPPADVKRRDDLRRQAFEQQAKREKQQLDAWHQHEDAPDPRRTTSPAPKYVAPPVRNVPRPDVNAPPRGDAKPGHAPAEKVPPRTDVDGTRPPARKPGDG